MTGVRAARLPGSPFCPVYGQIAPAELDHLCRAIHRAAGARGGFPLRGPGTTDAPGSVFRRDSRADLGTLSRAMRSDGPYLFQRALFNPDELPPDTFFLISSSPSRVLRQGLPHAVVLIQCLPRQGGAEQKHGTAADLWRRQRPGGVASAPAPRWGAINRG
jgi:hypothetical protein